MPWTNKEVFWWPAFGFERPDAPLLPAWPIVVLLELLGVAAAAWIWIRFGLADRARRTTMVRTGRVRIVGEPMDTDG